jgi:hypothetical protein
LIGLSTCKPKSSKRANIARTCKSSAAMNQPAIPNNPKTSASDKFRHLPSARLAAQIN